MVMKMSYIPKLNNMEQFNSSANPQGLDSHVRFKTFQFFSWSLYLRYEETDEIKPISIEKQNEFTTFK